VKKRLAKADLAAEVLKRIRAYAGCESVSKVILMECDYKDPDCNWDISVVDSVGTSDSLAVGPAMNEVYDEMASKFELLTVH
jgi:hypothetical protein